MDDALLNTLEPDLLRSLVAIAETGSFTAAAQHVHRTQSAVSMQIKRLEELIGRPLFTRDGRCVALTRDGERLLGHARRILQAHRAALAEFDDDALEGTLVLGAPDDFASTFLPRILASFAQAHPRATVELVCRPSSELVRALAVRSIDLTLVTQGSGERGGTVVRHESIVWVTSPLHAAHEQIPLPLAAFAPDCLFRRAMLDGLARQGRASRIAFTSVSFAGILAAVGSGLAVGTLLRSTVPAGLRVLDERHGMPALPTVGIVLAQAAPDPSPLVRRLEEAILAHFETSRPLPETS